MSEHDHPEKGDGAGGPSGAGERPVRRDWFFYVAGFFLVIAMLCLVLSNTLNVHPPNAPLPPPPQAEPVPSGGEK